MRTTNASFASRARQAPLVACPTPSVRLVQPGDSRTLGRLRASRANHHKSRTSTMLVRPVASLVVRARARTPRALRAKRAPALSTAPRVSAKSVPSRMSSALTIRRVHHAPLVSNQTLIAVHAWIVPARRTLSLESSVSNVTMWLERAPRAARVAVRARARTPRALHARRAPALNTASRVSAKSAPSRMSSALTIGRVHHAPLAKSRM